MSEWKRNKRRTDGFPKGLLGKKVEARHRDGQIFTGVVGEHPYLNARSFNTGDDMGGDVMAYRVVSEPAAAPSVADPDYAKGFPRNTTAKDIGAKVGDSFLVVGNEDKYFQKGQIAKLAKDDGSECPFFSTDGTYSEIDRHCLFWHELAPVPPKTAIEMQAEEVGIPEPVRLADDSQPDADGWIEWNGGECPVAYDAAVEYKMRDGEKDVRNRAESLRWAHANIDSDIIAYRPHKPQEWPENRMDVIGQNGNDGLNYDADCTTHVTPAAVNVLVDLGVEAPTTAPDFLQSALQTLTQRGKDYDKPEGERSAAAVAVAFNAITGRSLTEAEVYLVLQLVKDVRQWQCADYHADSALDCVAYAALKAEALANTQQKEGK